MCPLNVSVPNDVDIVLLVQRHQFADAHVAARSDIGFPQIAVIVFIGTERRMMMANQLPSGRGVAQRLIEPSVLFAGRVHFSVRIDHKEVCVAEFEFVVVFGIGQPNVIEVIPRVLFMVAQHGIKRDVTNQRFEAGEKVLGPMTVISVCVPNCKYGSITDSNSKCSYDTGKSANSD